MKTNERYYLVPYNSLADVVRLLAERSDTKSNVKLGGFRLQLQASNVSNHAEELWYNETVCLWMTIYLYIYIYIYIYEGSRKKYLLSYIYIYSIVLVKKRRNSLLLSRYICFGSDYLCTLSKSKRLFVAFRPLISAHTHTHTHTYIYIYIYICVCVCVCFKHCN